MTEKRIVFGCWNNDPQRINEPGQTGLIRSQVFQTEKAARAYYNRSDGSRNCATGDVIVRITVEALGDV